jgi:hypothetical protein
LGLSLGGLELANEGAELTGVNVGETGGGKGENVGWAGGDVDVLAIVPTKQRDHLRFEASPTAFSVRGDLVAKGSWKANGSSDRGVIGES